MPLFDRYTVVDWSANARPKTGPDSIWSATARVESGALTVQNHPTRRACETWLLQQLTDAVGARERVLVGLDFPYGYPAGFARSLGLGGEPWRAIWALLAGCIRDDALNRNNRFEVAAGINRRLGLGAPFWGRPQGLTLPALPARREVAYRSPDRPDALPEWRAAEAALRHRRKRPQSAWKLLGAGSVGSQSLLGIPVLHRLCEHRVLRPVSRVWPFEVRMPEPEPGGPAIVHAEIWPSLTPFARERGSCRDEQQVRALTAQLRERDRAGRLADLFAAAPDETAVRAEEGWVLGATRSC